MKEAPIKHREKPNVFSAVQWTGINLSEIRDFTQGNATIEIEDYAWRIGRACIRVKITLHTSRGDVEVVRGDFIIKGINGEFYTCKPGFFKAIYEEVEKMKEEMYVEIEFTDGGQRRFDKRDGLINWNISHENNYLYLRFDDDTMLGFNMTHIVGFEAL